MGSVAHEMLWGMLQRRDDDEEGEADPDEPTEAGEKEFWTSWALFILIALLIIALFTSYTLKQKRVQAVHETVLSIFAGMVVGLVLRLSGFDRLQRSVSFDYQFFFNLLLPPIILASGYELHQANFFRNIGTILTFAFAGTFISALVLSIVLFLWTLIPLDGFSISFVEAFSVGATLSATDPVTILAIFNMYKVEPKLYTVIFGESILNDAIAIVLFETAQRYGPSGGADGSLTALKLFEAIGIFLLVFFGSLIIGVVVGIITALVLKYTHVRREPKIESCLIVLIAYASYFFSTGVHMSGIVSLLFCGITLKHYAYYNMSRRTQLTTKYIFQVMAQLSENFIFIYLGLDLFTEPNLQFKPLFILIAVVGICVARYMAVFPLSKGINWFIRYKSKRQGMDVADELPFAYQGMLFWAGLRGAVGVALAAGLQGDNAPALRATVLVVVVLTVIIFGGTTARMLEILEIRTGVVEEIDSDDEFDIEVADGGTYYKRSGSGIGHNPRRTDFTIPMDAMESGNANSGDVAGRDGLGGGRVVSRSRERKKRAAQHDRSSRSKDPSSQKLLGSREASASGSGSGSPNGEGARRVSRNRGLGQRNDAELESDFELDLDDFSDDDLPPVAAAGPSSSSSQLNPQPSRAQSQQRNLSPRSVPPPATATSAGGSPAPGTSAEQFEPSGARRAISGATSAFRGLFSGPREGDHATWFQQLDEEYIKPTLLLDQGSGHHRHHDSRG